MIKFKDNMKNTNKIDGLEVVDLVTRVDDRGYLIEIVRATDSYFKKFGQVYVVRSITRGTVRAFHKHKKLWDYFFIVNGSAKYGFYDNRKKSKTYQNKETIVLTDRKPSLIIVPPGIYHGWMALEDNTILISTASEVYNREKPDEVRVPYNSFDFNWSVEFK